MLGLSVSLIAIVFMVYFLLKNYQAHVVLLFTGLFLLYFAILFELNAPDLFGKMKSTGLIWFDPIAFFASTLSSRAAGLGLIIMAASGYAKYMDIIGASKVLAGVVVKPLELLSSPYLVLGCSYVVGQFLNIFIPSAAGLALLLMVTVYPVLRRLGIPRISAAAVVATSGALDLGPASGNANLAARNANMDVTQYFVEYQIPAALVIALGIAIAHIGFQYYMDKRDAAAGIVDEEGNAEITHVSEEKAPPKFYIILPMLPLILLILFSPFVVKGIRLNVPMAMFISAFISIFCECIRHRSAIKAILKDFMQFFDTMGKQFARVVTLIVAGEVFARGLMATGTVRMIIEGAQTAQIGAIGIVVLLTLLIAVFAVIMGSGNAPFFSFAALAPNISSEMGISAVSMLLPMQLVAGIARGISPITAVVVATAGVANLSPFLLVRRTVVPMLVGVLLTIIMGIILR